MKYTNNKNIISEILKVYIINSIAKSFILNIKIRPLESLRFKLEVFIWRQWRHVGFVPKSSITFRGIFSVYNRMCIHGNTTRDVGRWFSPGTPASFTTKTGLHDIAEILLKVALKHQISSHHQQSTKSGANPRRIDDRLVNYNSIKYLFMASGL
jgi:hypothetical protein